MEHLPEILDLLKVGGIFFAIIFFVFKMGRREESFANLQSIAHDLLATVTEQSKQVNRNTQDIEYLKEKYNDLEKRLSRK